MKKIQPPRSTRFYADEAAIKIINLSGDGDFRVGDWPSSLVQ
jgi:hypothetical protein